MTNQERMPGQPLKVLLVEDDPDDVLLIREMLAECESTSFSVESVPSLAYALNVLSAGGIDVVLLDLGLPDSFGLETLDRVRATSPGTAVVVLTGLGDDRAALDAVHRGAQDYLVKGEFDGRVLIRCVRYAIERHQLQLELEEARQAEFERHRQLLMRDQQVARELQESLAPELELELESLGFAVESLPGSEVGGDFYDVIPLSDRFVAIVIADVSGHSLPAAVLMATARMAFRTYAAGDFAPAAIMEDVNRTILRSSLSGHYLTAFLGVLDADLLTLQYVNASHYTPFLVRAEGTEALDTEGLFVGMFDQPRYEQGWAQLEKDDKLLFYTDGLLAAFQAESRTRAQGMLREFLERKARRPVAEIVGELSRLSPEPEDDVIVLGVEALLAGLPSKTLVIPSAPQRIVQAEQAILPALSSNGYSETTIFAIKLALEEAFINAVKHGNQLDSAKNVTITYSVDDIEVVISVADEGEGFDPASVPNPFDEDRLTASSGRGLALIRNYMDDVRHNKKGNEITIVKRAPWAPPLPSKAAAGAGS